MTGDVGWDRYVLAILFSFLISICATPLIREFARYRSLLDSPNARSSHRIPVPRLGGLAIFLGTLVGGALIVREPNRDVALIAATSLAMIGMGLVDDFRTIGVLPKYSVQVLASLAIALWLAPEIKLALPFWDISLGRVASTVLSVVFIMAMVNAVNFLDGIDGIASGVAMVIAVAAIMLNGYSLLGLLLPLIGSLLGFLFWNLDPASIFMGDTGSQFVGFVLAIGILYRPENQIEFVPILICLLVLLGDTGFTLARRLIAGKNIFQPHQEHLYQRMVLSGYAHRSVANLYYVLTAICALLAYAYQDGGPLDQALILLCSILAFGSFVLVVFALERGVLTVSVMLPSSQRSNIMPLNDDIESGGKGDERENAL